MVSETVWVTVEKRVRSVVKATVAVVVKPPVLVRVSVVEGERRRVVVTVPPRTEHISIRLWEGGLTG